MPGVIRMPEPESYTLYDPLATNAAAERIQQGFERVVEHELGSLGFAPVFDDSFFTVVLRVVNATHTGTAYVELRFQDARMSVALVPYEPLSLVTGSYEAGDGDRPRLALASSPRLRAHEGLRNDFVERVLGMNPAAVFVSDETTMEDFPEPVETYASRIREVYGVDLSTLPDRLLPTVFDAITAHRAASE
jgi:hypothetical protein